MIVHHAVHKAKLGCRDEVVAMGRAECDTWEVPYRILRSLSGANNYIVFEFEFEDLTALSKFWQQQLAKPEMSAFMAKFNALLENESRDDLFFVM